MADNYFNQDFANSIDSEKLKMLKLIADHGAEGASIYDEARARQGGQAAANTSAATKGANNDAAVQQVAADFQRRNALYNRILQESADQSRQAYADQGAQTAIYKDSVGGDYSNRLAADYDIATANEQAAAAAAARRATRGSSSGFGLAPAAAATIPASYFDDQLNRNNLGFEPGLGDPTDPSYRSAPVYTPRTVSASIPDAKKTSLNPFSGLTAALNGKPKSDTTRLPAGSTLKALAAGLRRPTKSS